MQLGELNIPDPVVVKLTGAVGVRGVPGPVAVTVAGDVAGALTGTVPGLELTLVEVGRFVTVMVVLP